MFQLQFLTGHHSRDIEENNRAHPVGDSTVRKICGNISSGSGLGAPVFVQRSMGKDIQLFSRIGITRNYIKLVNDTFVGD